MRPAQSVFFPFTCCWPKNKRTGSGNRMKTTKQIIKEELGRTINNIEFIPEQINSKRLDKEWIEAKEVKEVINKLSNRHFSENKNAVQAIGWQQAINSFENELGLLEERE